MTRRQKVNAALAARQQTRVADRVAHAATLAAFPEGCSVAWMHGRSMVSGIIHHWSGHGFGVLRAKVIADRSKKSYWIHAERILDYAEVSR